MCIQGFVLVSIDWLDMKTVGVSVPVILSSLKVCSGFYSRMFHQSRIHNGGTVFSFPRLPPYRDVTPEIGILPLLFSWRFGVCRIDFAVHIVFQSY